MSTANNMINLDQFDDEAPEDAQYYVKPSEIKEIDQAKLVLIMDFRRKKERMRTLRKIILGICSTIVVLVLALT